MKVPHRTVREGKPGSLCSSLETLSSVPGSERTNCSLNLSFTFDCTIYLHVAG